MVDKRENAKELRKLKKYEDAIKIYATLWNEENKDKWLGWEYGYCLKYNNNLSEAIKVCKNTYKIDKNFKANNNLLSWCIFEMYFGSRKQDSSTIDIKKIEIIAESITKIIGQSKGNPYEKIVFNMAERYKKKGDRSSYEKMLFWLEKLNVGELDQKTYLFTDNSGREIECHSRLEEYYSLMSKGLLELEKYQQCIECCDEALSKINKFHFDNNIWIEARKYFSIGMLGEFDDAILKLKNLILRKNHFSLLYKISILYKIQGNVKLEEEYLLYSLLGKEKDTMKINIIYQEAKVLENLGELYHAGIHYYYCFKLRRDNDWKISESLQFDLSRCPISSDTEALINSNFMKEIWLKRYIKFSKSYYGIINKIMPSGRTGFIKYGNNSIFFRMSEVMYKSKIKINDEVEFCITESLDKVKNQISKEAIFIHKKNR